MNYTSKAGEQENRTRAGRLCDQTRDLFSAVRKSAKTLSKRQRRMPRHSARKCGGGHDGKRGATEKYGGGNVLTPLGYDN